MASESEKAFLNQSGLVDAILGERGAQDDKWGEQNHPNGTGGPGMRELADAQRLMTEAAFKAGKGTWRHILGEEVREAFAESDPTKLSDELIQCAAVCVAWAESILRGKQPVEVVTKPTIHTEHVSRPAMTGAKPVPVGPKPKPDKRAAWEKAADTIVEPTRDNRPAPEVVTS